MIWTIWAFLIIWTVIAVIMICLKAPAIVVVVGSFLITVVLLVILHMTVKPPAPSPGKMAAEQQKLSLALGNRTIDKIHDLLPFRQIHPHYPIVMTNPFDDPHPFVVGQQCK